MSSEASREVLWNISYYYLLYPMFIASLLVAGFGVYKRIRYWWQGKPDLSIKGPWWPRLSHAFSEIALHKKLFRVLFAGTLHSFIFWSFLVLLFATTMVALDMYFVKIFHGSFYLVTSLLADLAGGFFTVGIGMALFRRYVSKRQSLKSSWQDATIHGGFFYLMASGFLLEGIRIHYTSDPWALWTPVGYAFSLFFIPIPEAVGRFVHVSNWWLHAFVTFALIALIPYTKLFHLVTIPLNTLLQPQRPRGALKRVDLEALMAADDGDEDFSIGVATLKDTTWKERLDHDACIECKRCDDVCPAHVTGHNLSPMGIMLGLRGAGRQTGDNSHLEKELVGTAVEAVSLWECRTCYACVEACPANIDQLGQIVEMRRSEVLMKGELPQEGQNLLRDLETRGNPFGSQEDRLSWIAKEGFRVLKPGEKVEVLYWIGCATSFDPRKQKVARDLVKIFERAKVDYAVLGEAEGCNGDPARLLGDENIFQTMAKEQASKINKEQFDLMVVNCPHCYSAFDNEYPQFGLEIKVMHHSEFIKKLVNEGRLDLEAKQKKRVTFHDPCYLGRVQGVYDEPRDLITKVTGERPVEMSRNREKSGCCGAGGGHFWMDLRGGERLDTKRIQEAEQIGADTIGVGCVFCMQMLENGIKAKNLENKVAVKDVAELVAESMTSS